MTKKKIADPSELARITGYKKVVCAKTGREYILQLTIPAKARRVFPIYCGYKARAERARVVKIWFYAQKTRELKDTTKAKIKHVCYHDDASYFTYNLGEMAVADGFNPSLDDSCGAGISFFLDIEKAKIYF